MSELLLPATTQFRFNSHLLALGLADVSQEDAVRRWKGGDGSSIAYVTGHITSSRYGLLKILGVGTENPHKELFGAEVGSKDGSEYPPLEELRSRWQEVAEKLLAALDALSDEQALAADDGGFPTPDQTLRGRLAFTAWHECYHIGQIGLMRTEMGYPSMRQTLYAARQAESA